jgi:hypothetical protein
MACRQSFSAVLAPAPAAAVALAALYAVRLVGVPPVHFLPPSFVTDTVLLALSGAVRHSPTGASDRRWRAVAEPQRYRF